MHLIIVLHFTYYVYIVYFLKLSQRVFRQEDNDGKKKESKTRPY